MKFSMKRNEAGFSLVELMIVVGIIGILASLAMPKMQIFMAKARQSEAKGILANIFALQNSYKVENNRYGNKTEIGYADSNSSKSLYTGNVTANAADSFTGEAALKTNVKICGNDGDDTWTVNENQSISAPSAPSCN